MNKFLTVLIASLGLFLNGCNKSALQFATSQSSQLSSSVEVSGFQCLASQQNLALPSEARRLTFDEYRNSLQSLLGANIFASLQIDLNQFPFDDLSNGMKNFQNVLSSGHATAIVNIAAKAAELAVQAKGTFIGTCATAGTVTMTCVKDFIRKFGAGAFRRPLNETPSNDEVSDYYATYLNGQTSDEGFELLVSRFLISGFFVLHVEEGGPISNIAGQNVVTLTPYEIANRISYMATGFPPDASLLADAQSGAINNPTTMKSQIVRLVSTPAGKKKMTDFFDFWLQTKKIPAGSFGTTFLGGFDANGIRSEMLQELNDYISYMMQNGKGYVEFMTSKAVFPTTARMASVYGSSQWTPGQAPPVTTQPRSGLIGRAALLMQGSDNASPILRGVKMRTQILCDDLGLPSAADIADRTNQVQLSPLLYSARSRVTELTKPALCMACHSQINPLGFSFEQFDSLGRFRQTEGYYNQNQLMATHQIDTSVQPAIGPGGKGFINTLEDLSSAVAANLKGPSCYVKQIYRFNNLRDTNTSDGCAMNEIRAPLLNNGSLLDAYIAAIGHSKITKKAVMP